MAKRVFGGYVFPGSAGHEKLAIHIKFMEAPVRWFRRLQPATTGMDNFTSATCARGRYR
jgi:hypothetical protein